MSPPALRWARCAGPSAVTSWIHATIKPGASFSAANEAVVLADSRGDAVRRVKYYVDLSFPGIARRLRSVSLLGVPLTRVNYLVVIGRDILRAAHFSYDGPAGHFTISW